MRYQIFNHILLSLGILIAGCTAETAGTDSDGDGLSDDQEMLFCTDPHNPDTDGDTLPDSADPSPCDEPGIIITPSIVASISEENEAAATVLVSVKDERMVWRQDVAIAVTTTFGNLSSLVSVGTGIYEVQVTSSASGKASLTFETTTNGIPDGRASESIQAELKLKEISTDPGGSIVTPDDPKDPPNDPKDPPEEPPQNPNDPAFILPGDQTVVLEVPGVNPGRYAKAGKMHGELWVLAIDGSCLDWSGTPLKGYADAFVQVDLRDGHVLTGRTNDEGWVHFEDDRLESQVSVTVGAKGARYVTWMDVDARVISAGIHGRDIPRANAAAQGSTITGVVRGFWGETGLPTFPKENTNVFGTFNIAIVQVGIRNMPLSSMNTGSILLPPDSELPTAEYFEVPPNLVLANLSNPQNSRFSLSALKPGKYIVFALAGAGGNIMNASKNPYEMLFEPMAMGFTEVEVKAGETADIQLDLSVDLRQEADKAKLHLGQFPNDPKTGKPLPMGLLLPLMNTGKGYVFVDVNSAYNFSSFKNPLSILYPPKAHSTLQTLGLDVQPMAVGLAAREAQNGFDLPGISTLIQHPGHDAGGNLETMFMNDAKKWPALPEFVQPAPPAGQALDAVGGTLGADRRIAWKGPSDTDMTVLRFNYMTPPIHNKILNSDIGASQAHLLWEVYVPGARSDIVLPDLDKSAPDYPVLHNYEPTSGDEAYQYDAHTIELEISPYYMGPKKFNYNADFLIDDVNMNAWGVSQDSYLFRYE
ncbi:MAG: hypothetical protein J6A01_07695 [Proteobacteria bacterium]|nr:hypothetical protein [Pseudomonadota bacterium]